MCRKKNPDHGGHCGDVIVGESDLQSEICVAEAKLNDTAHSCERNVDCYVAVRLSFGADDSVPRVSVMHAWSRKAWQASSSRKYVWSRKAGQASIVKYNCAWSVKTDPEAEK